MKRETPILDAPSFTPSCIAVERALTELGVTLVGELSKEALIPHVIAWRQRVFDFRPEAKVKDKLSLGPPALSPKQKEILDGWPVGDTRGKGDIGASISSIRSLVRKGYLAGVEGVEGEESTEGERWIRTL